MFAKFLQLEPEKQVRIINAAAKEFAQKGYKNASTNEMVKEAGISKGILFHYFNNKKDLYLFLFDHFADMLMEKFNENTDWRAMDLFDRYRHMAVLKMGLFHMYPEMFSFTKNVFREEAPEIKPEIEERKRRFTESGYKDLFKDIDLTGFREGIDVQKALQIIFWTMEGFAYKQQEMARNLKFDQIDRDELFKELDDYIGILRKSFYK
jgi:TetR/AcrR family transcriptional regulator